MMKEARSRYDGKKVLILQGAPPRFYVQNEAGTVGSMFSLLGFKNVVGKGAGPMVPLKEEEALSYDPDLIVFVSAMGGGDETKVLMEKNLRPDPFIGTNSVLSKRSAGLFTTPLCCFWRP